MFEAFIGWDPREAEVADVCRHSMYARTHALDLSVQMIRLEDVRAQGLYTRTHSTRNGQLWDNISEAPMSTEFAISRFLVPFLAKSDWALFCDCDFLWLEDIGNLTALLDDQYAVMCVHHNHVPDEAVKMDSQIQTRYQRKNWSSMVLWNLRHPANGRLTLDMVNSLPGRDLHRFCWLEDHEIGAIPTRWNWLEGTSDPAIDPAVVHYTRGGPWFKEWQHVRYADLWLNEHAAMLKAVDADSKIVAE